MRTEVEAGHQPREEGFVENSLVTGDGQSLGDCGLAGSGEEQEARDRNDVLPFFLHYLNKTPIAQMRSRIPLDTGVHFDLN